MTMIASDRLTQRLRWRSVVGPLNRLQLFAAVSDRDSRDFYVTSLASKRRSVNHWRLRPSLGLTELLKLKRVGIDTYNERIAYVDRHCQAFRPDQHRALKKVRITGEDGREILASLAIADDEGIVADDEVGLSEQGFSNLGLPEGSRITIAPAVAPRSLESVRAKIRGATLSSADIRNIVIDIARRRYSEMELAAFLIGSASYLTTDELLALTEAMIAVGSRLEWPQSIVVDKHCIGGVPGNRTSMVIVPIVAAHGLTIPKTSSRSITSPAGTADTMEVLARVDLSAQEMRHVVNECGGCVVWGGKVNLSPADDIMISVQRPLGIDTREQMVASILSKKVAAGSKHLVIDIPVGRSAKVRGSEDAVRLRKLFEFVGDKLGLHIDVAVTSADEPIGRGIGPVLEARDVMAVLRCETGAPADLREKSLQLAGRLIEVDPACRGGAGYARARELLDTGSALRTMERIVALQGPSPYDFQIGDLTQNVFSPARGRVKDLDCYRLARIARLAGAPLDRGAGIDLLRKTGDFVEKGEAVYRIHAARSGELGLATEAAERNAGFAVDVSNGS
jgi:thymidine phosphorylase